MFLKFSLSLKFLFFRQEYPPRSFLQKFLIFLVHFLWNAPFSTFIKFSLYTSEVSYFWQELYQPQWFLQSVLFLSIHVVRIKPFSTLNFFLIQVDQFHLSVPYLLRHSHFPYKVIPDSLHSFWNLSSISLMKDLIVVVCYLYYDMQRMQRFHWLRNNVMCVINQSVG